MLTTKFVNIYFERHICKIIDLERISKIYFFLQGENHNPLYDAPVSTSYILMSYAYHTFITDTVMHTEYLLFMNIPGKFVMRRGISLKKKKEYAKYLLCVWDKVAVGMH